MENNGKTPIACSSCAKAKAKCDKKVPCTRCANKRIICQPRTARRSCDFGSNSELERQPTQSSGSSTPQTGVNSDNSLQWGSGRLPASPTNYGPLSSLSGLPTTLATGTPSALDILDQPMQSSDLAFEFDSGHDYLRTGLAQSPPNTRVSSTPAMQPFSEMGNFLECMDYSSGGGNASSSAGGLHHSLDFGMPTMPNLPFPMDKMQSMNYFDDYPVPERVASSSSRTSGPISSAHHSQMGSPSRASSQSSRPPYGKPFQDSGPCPYSIQEHKAVVGGQEGWYSFKCNPTTDPSACPKTARIHLESLEQTRQSMFYL